MGFALNCVPPVLLLYDPLGYSILKTTSELDPDDVLDDDEEVEEGEREEVVLDPELELLELELELPPGIPAS